MMMNSLQRFLFVLILIIVYFGTVSGQERREYSLIMRNTGKHALWDGREVRTYGFATRLSEQPPIPGPMIYAEEGDSVIIFVRNISQGMPHTIHLHGLDVDMANDGVPETSFEIPHMETGIYRFKAPHPGSYLYHCHVNSVYHVQMGMYGLVVIGAKSGKKEAWTGGPAYDHAYNWVTSEFDSYWHDSLKEAPHDTNIVGHRIIVPAYLPDYFLVNGKSRQLINSDTSTSLLASLNEKILLRVANIGYLYNRIIFPPALKAIQIASDGRVLPQSVETDTLYLYPGERYAVILQSDKLLADSVFIDYLDMNNHQVKGKERVPVSIVDPASRIPHLPSVAGIKVFPNPAMDKVALHTLQKQSKYGDLLILDAIGGVVKTIKQFRLSEDVQWLDIQDLAKGCYHLVLMNEAGVQSMEFATFIKE